jgi:hypothetical protein
VRKLAKVVNSMFIRPEVQECVEVLEQPQGSQFIDSYVVFTFEKPYRFHYDIVTQCAQRASLTSPASCIAEPRHAKRYRHQGTCGWVISE